MQLPVGKKVSLSLRAPLLGFVVVALVVGLAVTDARAQAAPAPAAEANGQYDVLPLELEVSRKKMEVDNIRIKQTSLQPGQRELIQEYYLKYALARWTQPEGRTKIVESDRKGYRRELRQEIAFSKGEVHDQLNRVALQILQEIALGNYHPPARVNAMLAISELNAVEPQALGDPGQPMPETVPAMLTVLSSADLDAVRVAALVGLLRHAKAKSVPRADPNFAAMLSAARELVIASSPPAGRTAEGHGWMRAQAADILGELGVAGARGEYAVALGALAGESSAPLTTRRAAARALGKLNYSNANVDNPSQLVVQLAKFAFDTCDAEKGGVVSKRRLKQRMVAAKEALTAIKSVVSDNAGREMLKALEPPVDALLVAADTVGEANVAEALAQQQAKIEPLIK